MTSRTEFVETVAGDEAAHAIEEELRAPGHRLPYRLISAVLPGIVFFGVIFGAWELLIKIRHITPVEAVAPSAMVMEVWRNPAAFMTNNWVTLEEAGLGFVVAVGISLIGAVLVAHSKIADRSVNPFVAMIQAIPILALAAPLAIWFGHGSTSKVVVAALITFAPLYAAMVLGFQNVDRDALELMRSVNASRTQIFLKLRLPNSLPYVYAATKICVPLAIVGATVGEFFNSFEGLGYMMVVANNNLAAGVVWGALLVLVIDAVVLRAVVSVLGRRLLGWSR